MKVPLQTLWWFLVVFRLCKFVMAEWYFIQCLSTNTFLFFGKVPGRDASFWLCTSHPSLSSRFSLYYHFLLLKPCILCFLFKEIHSFGHSSSSPSKLWVSPTCQTVKIPGPQGIACFIMIIIISNYKAGYFLTVK